MTAILSIWTPERVEQLKRCFDAGLTCREIAVDIGVSRNAVIGKLSRLNLTREPRDDDATRPARKASPRAPRARTVRHQIRMLQAEYGEAPPEEPIANGHCCSLLELDEQRCRWPVETPDASDFRFCGNRPVDGLPYCAGHARLAYQPSPRARVARG
ncbi:MULTISPECIES: GcrA family cell cycle regulator [Bradyrhizobium]|jgi:GcrA cell cycle regulator|uniref:GcrA family cell cycle regulator n=1 Tax=Bradyrhizobium TaxID=374 RepID=UPI0004203510|nr:MULTISPECIES: GcrA family cell cycle regulator [Bradyrhizobium]RZN24179.1 GcrA-like regulator [Bradyrhizobium sp. Leo121]